MNRWTLLGGALLAVTGAACMKEQGMAMSGQARTNAEQQQAAAQASASQQVAELSQRLAQQEEVIRAQSAQLGQLRSMQRESVAQMAPAGRQFTVKLDRPINSSTQAGDSVTAHLASPIFGPGGAMIAAEGALVTARVDKIERGSAPVVELSFKTIETVDGRTVPLHATVQDQQSSRLFDAQAPANPSTASYDAALYPPGGAPRAVGGGPSAANGRTRSRGRLGGVRLSPGTPLDLELTAPLGRTASQESSTTNHSKGQESQPSSSP